MGRTPYGGGGYPPSQGFSFLVIGLDQKILNTPGPNAKENENENENGARFQFSFSHWPKLKKGLIFNLKGL